MSETEVILKKKLDAPQTKGKILRRERLLSILRQNLGKKLILICADAGYGKTTLLAQFCQEVHDRCVFYDLNAQDSDVSIFFDHLIAGIRKYAPGFGQRVRGVLAEKRSSETIVGTFINEFLEYFDGEFYIVFDDYHRLRKDRKIADILNYFLRHLPANLHFVVSSRTTPPLYLSYYLAKQELLHLDREHLQFDVAETRALLYDIYGLEVNEDDISRIAELSGGWVTVIQLILQKISTTPDAQVSDTLNTYLASGEELFDYFAQEVFCNQNKTVRDFLIQTSVLEYLNADICDHILGDHGSGQIINRLETEHTFVLRVGSNVMYHPVFQEFLYKQLTSRCKPSDIKRLHIAASDFLLERGDYTSAVHHLIRARSHARAAKILQKYSAHWCSSGQFSTFLGFTEKLPGSCVDKYPFLRLEKASMYFELMKIEQGLKEIERAMRRMRKTNDRKGIFKAYSMKCHAYHCLMQMAKALYYAKKADSLVGKRRSRDKVKVKMQIGTAYRVLGRFRQARRVLSETLEMARAFKDPKLECEALHKQGMLFYNMSDFREAERIFIEIVAKFQSQMYPLELAYTYRNLGSIAADKGNVSRALHYIELSESIAGQYNERYLNGFLTLLRGRVSILQGDLEGAINLFKQVIEYNMQSDMKITDLYAALDLVDTYLKLKDVSRASKQLDFAESIMANSQEIPQHVIAFLIAKGRFETAQDKLAEGQASLEKALHMSGKVYDPVQVTAIYYALSENALACRKVSRALDLFKKCLEVARRYRLETYLALQGRTDIRLFELALEQDYLKDFVIDVIKLVDSAKARDTVKQLDGERDRFDLACRFFGLLEIRDADGHLITPRWRTTRTRAIFVALNMNHPKGCTKEMMVEMCWPHKKIDQATRSLQVEISSLRKVLRRMIGTRFASINPIIYHDDCYKLNPHLTIKRDATEFESLVHEAMAKESTNRLQSMRLYNDAVDLYRGDFCEGMAEDWCSNMRSYYRDMMLNVLERSAQLCYDLNDTEKSLSLYRRALSIDRYDETVHIGIMRCLSALGDPEGVQRQYKLLTKTLLDLNISTPPTEATKIYRENLT
jgi:LuxR family maltose regulon positive regulatory protein